MFQMNQGQADQLSAAQDAAAGAFWAYPGSDWQSAFQADWLQGRFGLDLAQSPDGLVWGADD